MQPDDERRRSRLWYATADIDDYFRRLGGSGCYSGYWDWHVPALMTLALDHHVSHQNQADQRHFEYAIKNLISHRMWEETDGLPQRALALVAKHDPTPDDIEWFTHQVTERYPMAYGRHEKDDWKRFLERWQQYAESRN